MNNHKKVSILLFFCLGLLQFNATSQIITFTNYNEANTLQFAGSGNAFRCIGIGDSVYWAGTQYKGLYKYDTAIKVWYKSSQLTNVFINDIKRDKNGGVWIAQSGTSGQTGGASNIAGGINYFPEQYDFTMKFYSVPGTTTGGGLVSRNVRSLFIDKKINKRIGSDTSLPKVWAAAATYITSSNTVTGGISIGLMKVPNYFESRKEGLQLAPFNGSFPVGTPSCDAIGGNDKEVWVSVRQNFGRSQIIRYRASTILKIGTVKGKYDNVSDPGIFAAGFRAQAIFFDSEDRRWVGLQTGGLAIQEGEDAAWAVANSTNMPAIFPVGTSINNNAIIENGLGNIYIGTSTGLVVFDGGGAVTDPTRYTRYTTTDGLPSNNITGLAYDTAKGRLLIASDVGITFLTVRNPIEVSMEWDHSFPTTYLKPKGVAADGVSRIYLKIKNGDPLLPAIKNVEVSLDNYSVADSSQRGKLVATTAANLDHYSDEANTGRDKLIYTDHETKPGEFWFWYVAPTDFSNDAAGSFANSPIRSDNIKVKVTYINNATDERIFKDLRVVRPPLLLVHGLASGPDTWNSFYHDNTVLFTKSTRFKHVWPLTLSGRASFFENAITLLGGDIGVGAGNAKLNTIQGNIEKIRDKGFACNQVDYVCHSMGGDIIRYAIDRLKNKFYTGEGSTYKYKNYGAGFTHKIITINTPHNSSTLADAIYDYIPLLPKNLSIAAGSLYLGAADLQKPYDFIEPKDPKTIISVESLKKGIPFKASAAVTNLKVRDEGGGINLAATNAKFHMITGNVQASSIATDATLAAFDPTLNYVTTVIQSMLDSKLIPAAVKKKFLEPALEVANISRIFTFFSWYNTNLGFPNFLAESDLIVPLASENARIPLPGAKKYITPFENTPGSIIDASHVTILKRKDVGQRVYNLLNSQLYGPLFGDVIPANTDPEPLTTLSKSLLNKPSGDGTLNIQTEDSTYFDTTKIRIDAPLRGDTSFADSAAVVKFRLKDTANLSYVQIHFQNTDSFRLTKTKAQQVIPMSVSSDLSGINTLWAIAAYHRPDNGMKYYIDTFDMFVKIEASLQGFRVNDSNIVVTASKRYYPPYQVSYRDQVWVGLPITDTTVSVTFDPQGIITLVDSTRALKAIAEGETTAIFTYKGISDTVALSAELPADSFAINHTIAAGNFRNPAIWSNGLVPDMYDSVIIQNNVTMDTSLTIRAIRINTGASFTLNNSSLTLLLGDKNDKRGNIDNYGTLNIQNGNISLQGYVRNHATSTFSMTGGTLKISGNTGVDDGSVPNGSTLFQADSAMASFAFTGGNLQITDPPIGASSQTVSCPYDFGPNSTLILGDGASTTASKNTDGFGGNLFPNKIGKLIIDAKIKTGNRQFINKKALNVKGNMEVRTGSGVILQAPITVNQ
jgi:triacylglycerol esterase/lipase EstA (alpha/beta hydrolase family)/uncharacterized protein (DUF427 family)